MQLQSKILSAVVTTSRQVHVVIAEYILCIKRSHNGSSQNLGSGNMRKTAALMFILLLSAAILASVQATAIEGKANSMYMYIPLYDI